jgi:hypothetical protein
VGSEGIDAIQGRYMIPVFPLLFFLFSGLFRKVKINLSVFVIMLVLLLNFVACNMLYDRYFREDCKSKTEFSCDAEEMVNGKLFTDTKTISLDNKAEITDKEHLSGKQSVAFINDSAETFIYHFKGLHRGDWMKVEVWRKGEGGIISLSGKDISGEDYLYEDNSMRYSGSGKWQRMRMRLIMDHDADRTDFVLKVKNTPGGKACFDDFHFVLRRY